MFRSQTARNCTRHRNFVGLLERLLIECIGNWDKLDWPAFNYVTDSAALITHFLKCPFDGANRKQSGGS